MKINYIDKNYVHDTFYRFLREKMSNASAKIAMAVLAETKRRVDELMQSPSENEIVNLIMDVEYEFGCGRMFSDPKDAIVAYTMMCQIDNFDMESLLVSRDRGLTDLVNIPPVVVKLFDEKIDIGTKSILIAEGEKFAPNLRNIVDAHQECFFTITTMSPAYKTIMENIFINYSNVTVVQASIYEYEFVLDRFDLILSMPVFGSRMLVDSEQHFTCREHEMVAIENLLLHLNRGGHLAILMPYRIAFAGGGVKTLREFIQQMYKIEEISSLPEGMLTWSGIKTYMIVIGTGKSDDVTIRRYEKGNTVPENRGKTLISLNLEDETFAMISEIEDQGDWIVDKFFASQDSEWQKYLGVEKYELGEVAQVFRGKNVSGKEKTGTIGIINISNIMDYTINYDSLDYTEGEKRKFLNHMLKTGDILVPARGTTARIAIFKEQSYPCIASSNLVVIRPKENVLNSTYLKAFFDSPLGKKLLESTQQGTTVMNLSYKDMQTLEIPVPDMDKQEAIAEKYNKELRIYLKTIKEAESRWETVLKELQEGF